MVKIIDVSIRGIAPLLQHRFAGEDVTDAPLKKAGKIDYSGESLKALYRESNGTIYQPASHIERAMVKAAARYQIGGKGKKTYKDIFSYAILVMPIGIPHKLQDWVIDRQPVVVQRARVMRERPRFNQWELDFEIHLLDDQVKPEIVNTILVDAGQTVGIGDYRPKYGRFMVTSFQVRK